MRLIFLYFIAFLLAFLGFIAIKLLVMVYVAIFYGGGYGWAAQDTKFVVVNGVLLGLVFCVFATVAYMKRGK
jgi:hypothetical protein